jgi:CsoR family transcriptional regulator, copper-sensing transcriptional repressor
MSLSTTTTEDLCRRLETAEGHLRAVRRMAGQGEECLKLLMQLNAVKAAIEKASGLVLREHLDQCLRRAIESGDRTSAVRELEAILKYLIT